MKLGIFHFELLYNVLQDMHFIYDEEEMAATVLSKISQALDAEAGTIFRFEPDGVLFPIAAYGVSKEDLRKNAFKKGVGVVGWVAEYLQPVKVDKPDADPRFFGRIDRGSGFKTRSIVAAPIIVRNEPIGIIEFLNRRGGPFVLQDMELISMVGRQVGIAMINARMMKERENILAFQSAVFGSLSAGLLVVDEKYRIKQANVRALEILGVPGRPVEGEAASEVLALCPELYRVLEETASSRKPLTRRELQAEIKGRKLTIGYSTVPVVSKEDASLGVALLFQDISSYV